MAVDPRDSASRYSYWQCVVADQYRAAHFIQPGDSVVDAGAAFGHFSQFALDLGAAHVTAYEPDERYEFPEHIRRGRYCLSDVNGRWMYRYGLDNPTLGHIVGTAPEGTTVDGFADPVSSICYRLDSVYERETCGPLAFLKIDVEGHEAFVIDGASQTIAEDKPTVAVSVYHHPGAQGHLEYLLKRMVPEYEIAIGRVPLPHTERILIASTDAANVATCGLMEGI